MALEDQTPTQLKVAKFVVVATWIFAAASFFPPFSDSGAAPLGRALFGILAAAHVVELALFGNTYRQSDKGLAGHIVQHMIFGVLHHTQVKRELESSGSGG